jgi:Ca2+-binding RTX toxin-like protein
MTKPVYTTSQVIAQLDTGDVWSGSTITYTFPHSAAWFPYSEASGFKPFAPAQQAAATLALTLWDDLIAPGIETVDPSQASTANIKYANSTTGVDYAQTYLPGGPGAPGSVWMNPTYDRSSGTNDLVTPKIGQWGFMAYLHETGHALGLNHPGPYDGGSPTYAADAVFAQDSIQYTVMSYFTADNTGVDWVASDGRVHFAQTPMLYDVAAVQAMYGADPTTRTGNTTYGFHATGLGAVASVFDFTKNTHPVVCIYDAGGIDTLDFSGFKSSSLMNLNPGSFSSCDGMTNNIAIAFSTTIENAVGDPGNDSIVGNAGANNLKGLAGNDTLCGDAGADTIDGGAGNDCVAYSGARSAYAISYDPVHHDFLVVDDRGGSPDGTDIVTNVETFSFSDGTVSAALLTTSGLQPPAPAPGGSMIRGTVGNDRLIGSAAGDTLVGLGGNDTLDGSTGGESLVGGAGNDTYIVAPGDVVTESLNGGIDTVFSTTSCTLGANVEKLVLTGTADIGGTGNALSNVLTGNNGDNVLDGGPGADKLNGAAGDDVLIGGAGTDGLTGGSGRDVFVFRPGDTAVGPARDVIVDFSPGEDRIDLSGFDASVASAQHAFVWIGGQGFHRLAGELRFSGGIVQADLNGDGRADLEIGVHLPTGQTLSSSDFLL